MLFSEHPRSASEILPENSGKIVAVPVTAPEGDLSHRKPGILQQFCGMVHPQFGKVLCRGDAHGTQEFAIDGAAGHREFLQQLIQRQRLMEFGVQFADQFSEEPGGEVIGNMALLYRSESGQLAQEHHE